MYHKLQLYFHLFCFIEKKTSFYSKKQERTLDEFSKACFRNMIQHMRNLLQKTLSRRGRK